MSNPYDQLPPSAFWRPAVAERHFSEIGPLWSPKFDIRPEQPVATFGSCFAQHIGKALRGRGFNWLCTESPPAALAEDQVRQFGYGQFSCRTGNIYTPTLLLQWVKWAVLNEPAPAELWQTGDRWFDPFRPAVEPDGFASAEEALKLRAVTIAAFRKAIETAAYFVFTLGLTECWRNGRDGYEYPMCPGTVAGTYDPEIHAFHNLDVFEAIQSLREAIDLMRGLNGKLRFILTVSPVPLTATYSGSHVLVATAESKSILRTVAGHTAQRPIVDYFPSYELVTSPATQGAFFAPNRRQVSPMGVDLVMEQFFSCLEGSFGNHMPKAAPIPASPAKSHSDVVCEEELLDAFGSGS